METSKQGFVEATAPYSVVSAQREDEAHGVQTSLPTVYIHTLGGLPLYAQPKPPGAQDTLAFPLSVPQPSSKQALSLLTLHVAGGVHLQQSGQKPGVPALAVRPKSAGKHMCSYCGRDCLKPSVLEKHLRCHTGERPYPCTTCGVAFKTQSNLYKHKRTQAHARLSSDSSERDSLTSQESVQSSRDVCWGMSSPQGQFEGSSSLEKDVSVPGTNSSSTISTVQVSSGQTGQDTGWGLQNAAAVGLILAPANGNQEPHNSAVQSTGHCVPNATQQKHEQGEHPAPPVPARHLSLQRQEATFFSKQWDSRSSGGKSQNHDSTDSGFSESSEQHWSPSPSGTLHDHSMESLAESGTEEQEEPRVPQSNTNSGATTGKGAKNRVSLLEKRKLEERICKLISENDALVDNKQLENVRPRKTMPSKQGSIDLPMPYTYKDSFHFEMKSSRHSIPNTDWQNSEKQVKQALYSSVPTQRSLSLEHAPLVRSSSLPFNVGSSGFERASTHGSYQAESTQQSGRDRMGHVYPGDLLMRSMDQPTPHHRSLVRQKAVDGLPAADFPNLPSTEEHFSSGPSGEGSSVEPTGEASGGKYRRKKLPKFSYNKWYMYGDGTFRKLCNMEKGSDRNAFRAKKSGNSMEQDKGQEIQSKHTGSFRETQSSRISAPDLKSDAGNIDSACNPSQVPPHLPPSGCVTLDQGPSNPDASNAFLQKRILRNPTVSTQQSITKQSNIQTLSNKNDRGVKELDLEEENSETPSSSFQGESHLPSERKKQRTDENICVPAEKTDVVTTSPCVESKVEDDRVLRQNQWLPFISDHTTEKYTNITEQKNTVTLKGKIMDFKTSPINHQLNQKNIQLQGYKSSPSQENVCRLSTLTKSSFLPKYQLKLPQSSDLMTSASCLTGMEQSLPLTQNQQVIEKLFSSNTPMTGQGQTFAPILASIETHIDKPSGTAVNRQSPPTPASSTSSVIGNDHVTAVTSISAHSNASYLSPSSQITQYKGKLTLLNSAKPDAAEGKVHDREQAGDIHIFLEIVSGEQLSVTETQRESKQEAVYRKDILQDMKSASTSTGIQMLCATQKPQERMAAEVQPPVSTAEKTTKEIAPSGEAPSIPSHCTSSDWGSVFHTKQHRYTDEPSQRSSVHSSLSVIPIRSCTNHFAHRDNSSLNLDETSTANQEASMQRHGECVGCRDAQSLNPHICPFQEGVGQISSVSLETCAADKPSEGVIETAETAEQLPLYRQDAPSLPAPVSVPADWKVGPYSPRSHKSFSVTALQQAHVKAPQKLFTSDEATESSGGSSAGPSPVQQQYQFKETASALQNTLHATNAPLQLIDTKKPSPSQCQEQKMFTCELQHPLSPPHASPGTILPLDQTTWSQSPDEPLTSQEGLDLAKKRGPRDGQQTLKIPTDSPISSSDGHAHGGHLSAVDPRAKHAARGSGEAREQQRQLEGGEESETKGGGRGLQDGGNLDASPTPELKQGASTEGLGVERDTGANETSWCGSLSLQPGVTARQTPTPDTAVLIGQHQPGVTARQTPTPDTAVLIGQHQPGVTARQTPTPDTAVLIGQLQPGVTARQTPTPHTAVLIGQLQPGVTARQTPTPDTAVLIGQHQPGVTARQTPTLDTTVLIGQHQPSMQNKAKEVNTLQTPEKTETCGFRKRQSGTALSHIAESCPRANFLVPAKGETGSQLTPMCRLGLFPTSVKNGTTQSADQAEAHNYKKLNKPVKLKRVLQTPTDPPAEVSRPSSCSSMRSLHPVSPAQLLGEQEIQAGSTGHRTSTSHSLNKRSLQSPEEGLQLEELRTSAQDKPGDLSQRCLQGPGQTPAQPKLADSAPSQPGPRRSPLIRSQTSPAFCLTPPCGRAKGLGRTEEPPGKAAASVREEGPDSSSSDDEGKLVIELE
ncbi:zinc finger protein 831 isoform X2 [Paramormyrops kingsleyae]|uniref:zinc finger protein 831 isoform X2 n=1 Tax=Paramormyrops kingsleyae TaxID=1676925 RepID=UPI003B97188E